MTKTEEIKELIEKLAELTNNSLIVIAAEDNGVHSICPHPVDEKEAFLDMTNVTTDIGNKNDRISRALRAVMLPLIASGNCEQFIGIMEALGKMHHFIHHKDEEEFDLSTHSPFKA